MQERDRVLNALLSLLDGWIGDTVATRNELRSLPHAAIVASSGFELSLALLRNHISDPGKVKILRRFLASMLPSADEHPESEHFPSYLSACILHLLGSQRSSSYLWTSGILAEQMFALL